MKKNASTPQEKTIKSVPIPENVMDAIKSYTEDHKDTLRESYEEAIAWFLEYKNQYGKSVFYFASETISKDAENPAKYVSMWLDSQLIEEVKALALKDNVPENRVLFSAFVYFLKRKEYLP